MLYDNPMTYEWQNAKQAWSVAASGDEMRFEVRNGDHWAYDSAAKERSEIASYQKLQNGQVYTISYKFMIEPGAANTADWLLIGQIHQTEDAKDLGVSPPFAIELVGEKMQIVVRNDPAATTISAPGTTVIFTDDHDLARGAWYDMTIQLKLDPKGSGSVYVWRDGVPLADYTGGIGYADAVGPYWKNGIYREASAETLAVDYKAVTVSQGAIAPAHAIAPSGPIQTVTAATTTTLGALGENLILSGSAAVSGFGNAYDNSLTGNGAANTLDGGAGEDTLIGKGGNDILKGGEALDIMYGGAGDDTFYVDLSGDRVVELANEGVDIVVASATFSLSNNVENLTLVGSGALNGVGNSLGNRIEGNAGANVLTGGDGNDTLLGGAGDDTLSGGDGSDTLYGGDGADKLSGSSGADAMYGGSGDDVYTVDQTLDRVLEYAGGGTDTVNSTATFTLSANIELLNLGGSAAINGAGNELANTINGNEAGNVISGSGGDDLLRGNGGNDAMYGGAGNDTVSAGAGDDLVDGGAGLDVLYGGGGADVFVFTSVADSTRVAPDRLEDYLFSGGDRINLAAIDANSALTGDQSFTFIGSTGFSRHAGELHYEKAANGMLLLTGDVNGDGIGDFGVLVRATSLVAQDFIL